MTATLKEEIPGARTAENNLGVRTYTRAFLVTSDNKTDSAFTVGSVAGLPIIGNTHPDDVQAYCRTLSVANTDPYAGWTVTAQYSTQQTISSTDPVNDEVLVDWDSEIYQVPVFADIATGDPIWNSAHDYFIDPVPTKSEAHLIARIQANVQSVPTYVLDKRNNVNNATITIGGLSIAAGLAKVQRFRISQRQRRNAINFYTLSFEVHIHEDGWKMEPLDAGFMRLVSGERVPIHVDSDGNVVLPPAGEPVNTPVALDGAGDVIAFGGTPFFHDFTIYTTSDLTTLPGIT